MKRLTNEEFNELAAKYLELKARAEKTESDDDIKAYKAYQNECITKLRSLVLRRVAKYKKFSNYPDLEQDGFEALLMSFNTYNPEKGPFSYWADQYIKTRVCRAANAHSTIRVPIKKARDVKPYKTSTMPIMEDTGKDPFESLEEQESCISLMSVVDELPSEQRDVVTMTYGLNGSRPNTAGNVMERLSISRQQYTKLLTQAKTTIKKQLSDLDK
jgi:RNA polymerase sigma factor (sigma-70 family)